MPQSSIIDGVNAIYILWEGQQKGLNVANFKVGHRWNQISITYILTSGIDCLNFTESGNKSLNILLSVVSGNCFLV